MQFPSETENLPCSVSLVEATVGTVEDTAGTVGTGEDTAGYVSHDPRRPQGDR